MNGPESRLGERDAEVRDVIVIGGGLAGIAAAIRALKHGATTTLIERRPFLGGRAFSFTDRVSHEQIDNGQHVILGGCQHFLQLLDDIGTRELLDVNPLLDVPVSLGAQIRHLRARRMLGNAAALINYSHLSVKERISLARCLINIKLIHLDPPANQSLRSITFSEWLASRGQSQRLMDRFWSLFILPVFNLSINEATAYDAILFTRLALLGRSSDTAIGYPRVGLTALLGKPALEFIRAQDGELILSTRANNLQQDANGQFQVHLSSGAIIRSRTVICALPPNVLDSVLPESDARFEKMCTSLKSLDYSPIVAVHLWYAKPFMDERVTAFIDNGLQWVFNDSAIRGESSSGASHIVVSLSGADEWLQPSKREILSQITETMREAFPQSADIPLVNSTVIKTHEATIRVNPAAGMHRLNTETEVPGFFIAGDWTNTQLPATMEGAVQSGNRAADLAQQLINHI